MGYEHIALEMKERIGVITLNRPRVMNALSEELMHELEHALNRLEDSPHIHVIILKGNEQHFAVGADIRDLQKRNFLNNYNEDFITRTWERVAKCRIPIIGGVAGFAMGAGCELAMMCDLVIAADNARFSQPEISIGLMPGAGGTQRLPRAIGKAKAMDLCLTGRFMEAAEAERLGLVSRIVPLKDWSHELIMAAERMTMLSRPVLMMIKESINRSFETSLSEGMMVERRMFHSLFSLEDPHEGMRAFTEKRPAVFQNK